MGSVFPAFGARGPSAVAVRLAPVLILILFKNRLAIAAAARHARGNVSVLLTAQRKIGAAKKVVRAQPTAHSPSPHPTISLTIPPGAYLTAVVAPSLLQGRTLKFRYICDKLTRFRIFVTFISV